MVQWWVLDAGDPIDSGDHGGCWYGHSKETPNALWACLRDSYKSGPLVVLMELGLIAGSAKWLKRERSAWVRRSNSDHKHFESVFDLIFKAYVIARRHHLCHTSDMCCFLATCLTVFPFEWNVHQKKRKVFSEIRDHVIPVKISFDQNLGGHWCCTC